MTLLQIAEEECEDPVEELSDVSVVPYVINNNIVKRKCVDKIYLIIIQVFISFYTSWEYMGNSWDLDSGIAWECVKFVQSGWESTSERIGHLGKCWEFCLRKVMGTMLLWLENIWECGFECLGISWLFNCRKPPVLYPWVKDPGFSGYCVKDTSFWWHGCLVFWILVFRIEHEFYKSE